MKRCFLLLASLLAAAPLLCCGDEYLPTLTVGDEVYSKVTVIAVTATHISFLHSRGVGGAKLAELEPAMQKHFGFDPAKAAAAALDQAQASALYRQRLEQPSTPGSQAAPAEVVSPSQPDPGGIPPHRICAKSFLGQPAPTVYAEKWLTPIPDTEGKFVLLDFWATWCGPCRQSIPHLNGLQSSFKKRLTVIGLSNQTEFEVRQMTSPKIDYAVAIDTRARASTAVEVTGIPHAMLIDPKGIVRFEGHPDYLTDVNVANLLAQYDH